ncbi:hypothetical protein HETIRDRAFT_479158 [Heterobasidion irregulare TC 32-1]|uniref:Mid2 domain-containing protein n=1 Tax=Heterobasidion irregulare (strain TC 32-1) TaxID=747525 RepID=W4JWP3_HETIT|nr:uncharacterized protein HETIRDRAFT_479158 [Heterobasidion irregulare TC 32-1]ETW77988.1 hypothetical protein HETIRDRAFT_479158 [Heterobasidion irregulare TC 32-1]
MLSKALLPALLSLSLHPAFARAYSWAFDNSPTQCEDLSLSISGSGGQAPYTLLIVPTGPSPLANNIEARTIQSIPFNSSTSLKFKLAYPANSSFVAVVSDASGFGTGGTSIAATVQNSADTSCYDSTKDVAGPWVFSTDPTGGLTQCESVRLYWNSALTNGTVSFVGVIPGGQSFSIPNSTLSTNSLTGTGFNWTVDVRASTTMLVVAGDDRGIGVGGSAQYTIGYATSSASNCLTDNSPSSTAGDPAGGSYPTSTNGSGTGGSSSSSGGSHTGAIVGGVVGGIAALIVGILLGLFCLKRRRSEIHTKERPVDLLQDHDDTPPHPAAELPQYYAPDPFLVPDPTIAATSDAGSTHPDEGLGASGSQRPTSYTESDILMRPGTPGHRSMASMSTNTRKGGLPPPQMRPVNFIQHDDAGPSAPPAHEGEEEPETIELPPAYTNLRT